MNSTKIVVALVAVFLGTLTARAQDTSTLQKGTKIRITPLTGHRIIGRIQAADESSITVRNSPASPLESPASLAMQLPFPIRD